MNNESDTLCGTIMIFKKIGSSSSIETKNKTRHRRTSHSHLHSYPSSHPHKRSHSASPTNIKTTHSQNPESEILPITRVLHHQLSEPIMKDDFKHTNGNHQDTVNIKNITDSPNGDVSQSIDDMLTTLNKLMENVDLDKK